MIIGLTHPLVPEVCHLVFEASKLHVRIAQKMRVLNHIEIEHQYSQMSHDLDWNPQP